MNFSLIEFKTFDFFSPFFDVPTQTLNPKWDDASLPTLQVQANSARRLKLHQLCFAAFDYDAASSDDAIGLAYLPLKDYIQDGYPAISEWKDFNLDLSQGGLPAGQLKGQMQIFWRKV
jgi:Ca2+-dependent lipid-binding protein